MAGSYDPQCPGKGSGNAHEQIRAAVQAAYYAPNQEEVEMIAANVLQRYPAPCPAAMKLLQGDEYARIAYWRFPRQHYSAIRTTRLLDRHYPKQRLRVKTILRFLTEKSCLKAAFATVWRASRRWWNERMAPSPRF
ncbi:transposase [Chloroflexota bacterium]